MGAKTLAYVVRQIPNRLTGGVNYVPAIIDRGEAIPLSEVVRRAIDRNLIAGLKTTAAKSIAEGVATQMREEFLNGRGVKFGNFFYARLYLSGKSDADGTLTDANRVNVRLYKGPGFDLSLDSFAWTFVGERAPVVEFVISDCANAKRGEMVKGETLLVVGSHLAFDQARGDTATLRWKADGEDASATLDVSKSGENLATVEWNAELDPIAPGTEATLELAFHTESGATFETTKAVTVVAG